MIVQAWRIVKARFAARSLDGEGAYRFGGRWSSRGTRMVYCASSTALAILEVLVHLEEPIALASWSLLGVEFDDSLVVFVSDDTLPDDWRPDPAPSALAAIGDAWVADATSVALAVPSIVVPHENNYLLNPAHPDFDRVRVKGPMLFALDPRLERP